MASGLPPPPVRAESGDFAWVAWYNKLYEMLSISGSVAWSLVDKAGSSIADLQNKGHALLTGVLGNGSYHLSSAEATNVAALPTASTIALNTVYSLAGDPTTSNIAAGKWAVYKNTSSGAVKLWTNDGGTMKSVALV